MSVDEALVVSDKYSTGRTVKTDLMRATIAIAAEVRSLREQNRRLRAPAVFDMDAAVEAVCAVWNLHAPDARRIITTATPHLPVYREFGADGKPFCRRSWNEGREAGIAAVAEAKESLQPDMEALRRDAERYRKARDSDADGGEPFIAQLRPQGGWGNGATDLLSGDKADAAIDAALAAQAGKQGGG